MPVRLLNFLLSWPAQQLWVFLMVFHAFQREISSIASSSQKIGLVFAVVKVDKADSLVEEYNRA